jgi:hypothetical protein
MEHLLDVELSGSFREYLSIRRVAVQVFVAGSIAYHMNCIAGLAFLKMMIIHELFPVRSLIRHDEAGSPTERTYIVERGNYCGSYKFGSVGDAFHCVSQRFRDLERDDIEFFLFHVELLPTRRFDYGIVTL